MARENDDRRFGEQPLAQTVAAAAAIRRLTGMLLSLEHPHPTVDAMLAQFADWERELADVVPPHSAPRRDSDGDDKRVYLGHAFDIGAFNPCFPGYRFDHLDAETASGTVTLSPRLRGAAGLGARWVSCRLLRLRHPAPQLRRSANRQDPLADRDVSAADSDPGRAALRHRPI